MTNWTRHLTNLNTDRNPNHWDERTQRRAPHKPFLLLSILDGIEQGWICDHKINLSQELIETFFSYWNRIMGEDRTTTIALPFYHMKSEPFWSLEYRNGRNEFRNSPSLGALIDRIDGAVIDEELYKQLSDADRRKQIRSVIIAHYFSEDTADQVLEIGTNNKTVYEISEQLIASVTEPFEIYHDDPNTDQQRLGSIQRREAGFSLAVRKNYRFTCAICGSRIITPGGKTLVEGAHIVPWSQSYNDDPRNGLSLCRSHHWMFDELLITIRNDYSIRISKWLKRGNNKTAETMKLSDKPIKLPDNESFLPSQKALQYHHHRFKEFQKTL